MTAAPIPFRVLVTGSRRVTEDHAQQIRATLARACSAAIANLRPVVIVQGECPYGGADLVAKQWATATDGVTSEDHPADWNTHGKAAGMLRNTAMVAAGADLCLAFPAPDSRGTWDCLTKAAKAGIHTRIYPLTPAAHPARLAEGETP